MMGRSSGKNNKITRLMVRVAPYCWVAFAPTAMAQSPAAPGTATAPPAAASAPAPDDPAAFAAADAAYRAMEQGRTEEAVQQARRAAQLAPRNVSYARLQMFALSAAGQSREAEQAASAVLTLAPDDTLALSERARLRAARGDAAGARADYESALRSPALTPQQRVSVLAELGRRDEARAVYAQLAQRTGAPAAGGEATTPTDLELAYLASRLELDREALDAFRRADAAGRLPATAVRDAAYAAVRAGDNPQAVTWFRRAVDAGGSGAGKLTPQEMFETRRSVAELTRNWGVFASLNYRGGGGITPGFGATPGVPVEAAWQAGAEAWWRPFGQHNGRHVELFARTFETLETDVGPTGSDSRQLGFGARIKPFTSENLVLSISRTDTRSAGGDWLLQAGYSADWGTDVRLDSRHWTTTRVSAEAGRYFDRDQNYAVANLQTGRSFRVAGNDNPTVLYPHGVVAAEYDSTAVRRSSVGAGVGVTLRQWFRGDTHAAPRSYVDVTVQYRGHVSGDERTKGWFLTGLLSF